MKGLFRVAFFAAMFALAIFAQGIAAAEKSFVVLPFTVNAPDSYKYLGKAVPGTILNKLNQPGSLSGKSIGGKGASDADARKALQSSKADYAIWGVINVTGNDAAIDVHAVGKDGKTWSKSASGPMANLTNTVQGLSQSLAGEAMGTTIAAAPAFMTPGSRSGRVAGNQGNSDILVNETGQNQVYLNPQFRYQGAGASDGSRLRSQRLKENMVDMALGDFNGDGKTEIAVISDHYLYIYLWGADGRLKELGKTKISNNNNFSMRAIDLNRDGATDMVISTFEDESNRPYSYFYSFKGGKFSQASPRIPYFASVLRMPPTFAPTLVGQGYDSIKLFQPGVHMLVKQDGKYALGARVALPSGANVFNVAWIPGDKNQSGDLLVMLTEDEKIKLFQGNGSGKPIHTTMERFSGSATGMDFYKVMPGLGIDKNTQLPGKYYMPMRLIAADIGNTGENVLLLNKPISTASQFFDRYRYFPQGEVHALFWDGVGLALKWKTRRIRGSVAEIDLGDVNNDGILDLVVGINTSPELGIGSRQSMITAYPLDVSQMNPNTPADMSDFEVNPNQ